ACSIRDSKSEIRNLFSSRSLQCPIEVLPRRTNRLLQSRSRSGKWVNRAKRVSGGGDFDEASPSRRPRQADSPLGRHRFVFPRDDGEKRDRETPCVRDRIECLTVLLPVVEQSGRDLEDLSRSRVDDLPEAGLSPAPPLLLVPPDRLRDGVPQD